MSSCHRVFTIILLRFHHRIIRFSSLYHWVFIIMINYDQLINSPTYNLQWWKGGGAKVKMPWYDDGNQMAQWWKREGTIMEMQWHNFWNRFGKRDGSMVKTLWYDDHLSYHRDFIITSSYFNHRDIIPALFHHRNSFIHWKISLSELVS